jgi:hypothetical protein
VIETKNGSVTYLNSGDWIENLTSLEYNNGDWTVYHYDEKQFAATPAEELAKKLPELNVVTDEVLMFSALKAGKRMPLATLLKKVAGA